MSNLPVWVDTLGYVGGIVGISTAIYLQFIVKQQVKAHFVLSFLAIGLALFFLSLRPRQVGPDAAASLRIIGYAIFLFLEIIGFIEIRYEIFEKRTEA